jgi:hypothetical protein
MNIVDLLTEVEQIDCLRSQEITGSMPKLVQALALFALVSIDVFSTTWGAAICARTPHLHAVVHQPCTKIRLVLLRF